MPHAEFADVVRALVVSGDLRTPYLAAGRGPAVVVLSSSPRLGAALLGVVPRRVRMLVPSPPAAESDVSHASWLEGFVDALGINRAWLVADASMLPLARAQSLDCPERWCVVPMDLAESSREVGADAGLRASVDRLLSIVDAGWCEARGSIDSVGPPPKVTE